MVCSLIGAKPLPEPMLEYWEVNPKELKGIFNQNSYIFIQENAFENVVCWTAAILSQS